MLCESHADGGDLFFAGTVEHWRGGKDTAPQPVSNLADIGVVQAVEELVGLWGREDLLELVAKDFGRPPSTGLRAIIA